MKKIDKNKIKTWFVTGASSGIGLELCNQLLEKGFNVIAVSRRTPTFNSENALCISCDVTDPQSIVNAFNKGVEKFGRIDVLSNNAGISSYLTLEEEAPEKMRTVMEVNFWGTYNTIKVLLPHFRNNSNGTIINNSSECGIIPRAFGAAYCSSKHAIEGLSSSLWHEAKSFCRVMTVELSFFEGTNIGKNEIKGVTQYKEYKGIQWLPFKHKAKKNDYKKAVKFIIEAVENKKLQRRLMLGSDIVPKIMFEIKSLKNDLMRSKKRALNCKLKKRSFLEKIMRRK